MDTFDLKTPFSTRQRTMKSSSLPGAALGMFEVFSRTGPTFSVLLTNLFYTT